MRKQDAYDWLGLKEGATQGEIKKAWMRAMKANHPDKFPDQWQRDQANVFSQKLNEAKETLTGEREATENGASAGGTSSSYDWFSDYMEQKAEAAKAQRWADEAMKKRDQVQKELWELQEKEQEEKRIKQLAKEKEKRRIKRLKDEERRRANRPFQTEEGKPVLTWANYKKHGIKGASKQRGKRVTDRGVIETSGNILQGVGDPDWDLWTQFSGKLSNITGGTPGGATTGKRTIGVIDLDTSLNPDETGMAWFDFFGGFHEPRNSPIVDVGINSPSRKVFDSLEPWSDITRKPRTPSKSDVCNACGKPFQSPFWKGDVPIFSICSQCDISSKSKWKTVPINW